MRVFNNQLDNNIYCFNNHRDNIRVLYNDSIYNSENNFGGLFHEAIQFI